ncbi:hypothetical protein BpHYR1_020227 [Brachionus plicatilis]|uniref:Uncharacterized protein n=1 Tax=Brachionus plicatilis TaxID=10195 RepID=A0A3M7RI29_BRAPC|nr:hypothetical protein BpHYR1_020227 [Brachionus plicatilis]
MNCVSSVSIFSYLVVFRVFRNGESNELNFLNTLSLFFIIWHIFEECFRFLFLFPLPLNRNVHKIERFTLRSLNKSYFLCAKLSLQSINLKERSTIAKLHLISLHRSPAVAYYYY